MDAKSARTANIREWVTAAGGPVGFANRYGEGRWVQAQVSQWTSTTNPKGIGHSLAREIESALRLPAGAMDRRADPELAPAAPLPANELDALRYAVAALASVMVVHRPIEATAAAIAIRRNVPAPLLAKGFLRELVSVLEIAAPPATVEHALAPKRQSAKRKGA